MYISTRQKIGPLVLEVTIEGEEEIDGVPALIHECIKATENVIADRVQQHWGRPVLDPQWGTLSRKR